VPVPSQNKLGGLCKEWHPDCWCICLCYLHFAPENPEDGEMYLLVPAYPGCPGQSPQSRKMVVCVCVLSRQSNISKEVSKKVKHLCSAINHMNELEALEYATRDY